MSFDVLERLGLFDFEAARLVLPSMEEESEVPRSFRFLAAAEFQIATTFLSQPDRPVELPVHVGAPAALLALYKLYGCSIGEICVPTESDVQLWDAVIFPGDLHKIHRVLGVADVPALVSTLPDTVRELTAYLGDRHHSVRVRERGIIELQSVLWFTRLHMLGMVAGELPSAVTTYIRILDPPWAGEPSITR